MEWNRDAINKTGAALLHVDMIVGQWVYGMRNSYSLLLHPRPRQLVCHFINITGFLPIYSILPSSSSSSGVDITIPAALDGRIVPVRPGVT
jgi:hypothetical protein